MARALLWAVIQDEDGNALAGAQVALYEEDGTTPLGQPIYGVPSGGTPLTQPLSADALGRVAVYADATQRVTVRVNGGPPDPAAFEPPPNSLVVNDNTSYAHTLVQRDPTGGLIQRLGYGPAGAETWVAQVHKGGLDVTGDVAISGDFAPASLSLSQPPLVSGTPTLALMQRYRINAKEFGVRADGSDDTAAINALIAAVRDATTIAPGVGLEIFFPPGRYSVGSINATKCDNLNIIGSAGGTFFFADRQTVSRPVWDFAGSSNLKISGIGIAGAVYGSGASPATTGHAVPSCAILTCDTADNVGNCNANYFDFIGGYGFFTTAFFYLLDTDDSTFVWCHPDVTSSPNIPNIYITSSNGGSVASAYQTVSAGTNFTGNLTFLNVGGQGIHFDGAENVNFFGGNIDATTFGKCLRFSGTNRRIGLYNVQLTCNNPGTNLAAAGGAITVAPGLCQSLTLANVQLHNLLAASSGQALIRGASGALFPDLKILGLTSSEIGGSEYVLFADDASPTSTVVVDGGDIWCGGARLRPGGTMRGVLVHQVGTYTRAAGADENNCLFLDPQGYPAGGAGIALVSNALRLSDGSAGAPVLAFSADTDTGILRNGANVGGLVAGGVTSVQWIDQGIQPKRIIGSGYASPPTFGTAPAASGWGAGATGTIVGTEAGFIISITAAGTPTANPTIVIAYPSPAYAVAPFPVVTFQPTSSGVSTVPQVLALTARLTTGFTLTCFGAAAAGGAITNFTPTAGQNYAFYVHVIG